MPPSVKKKERRKGQPWISFLSKSEENLRIKLFGSPTEGESGESIYGAPTTCRAVLASPQVTPAQW